MPHLEKYNRPDDAARTLLQLDNHTDGNTRDAKISDIYSYTVAWTATGTTPTIGDGTLLGYYQTRGPLVWVKVRLVWGTTTTAGTGSWRWSLPFPASAAYAGPFVGYGLCQDISTLKGYPCTVWNAVGSDPTVFSVYAADATDAADLEIGNAGARPFTWASTDQMIVQLEYVPDWTSITIDDSETG